MLILQLVHASRFSVDERRKKILTIVDQELSEVTRLSKQQNLKNPDTLLRIAELNLEKARLYREVENETYLAIPVEKRKSLNKQEYFKESELYFYQANKAALDVTKRFPSYSSIGDAYYVLAYNYKELGQPKKAQQYFELASKKSKDPKVATKSKSALAEFYFNDNKFKQAIPLYETSLKNDSENKWWTKDAFNLAWSYYRERRYNEAISLMLDVYRKSGGKYADMRSQVERDIGIFYVDADRMIDAINFYDKNGIDYSDQFIKMATRLTTQGRFDQAEKLLEKLKKIEKNQFKKNEISISQLLLYDKFNKENEHLSLSQELVRAHKLSSLDKSQFERVSFQVNKKAAELQKAVASDIYKSVPKTRNRKASEAISYFEMAYILAPSQKAEKFFFQGETAYASENYKRAIDFYIESFDEAKSKNDKKLMSQSIEGMLASLGQKTLPEKDKVNFYIPVYSRYLIFDSATPRASTIFVKLFNAQLDKPDIKSAEKTLANFSKNFPDDFKTQEGMLARVMDYYRERKDYSQVKIYVSKINDGQFKVSKKYADALRSLMTKMQIEGVQQSLEKGDRAVALKGYHQIFESSESTPKAKSNAAYNISALYFEMGDVENTYKWTKLAISKMEVTDVVKFSDSIVSIAAGLFLRQQFYQSADISHDLFLKICQNNSSNKPVALKNAIFIYLSDNNLDKALEIFNISKTCNIPDNIINEVAFELLKDLAIENRWETYEKILVDIEKNSKNHPSLIYPYEALRKAYVLAGNLEEVDQIEQKQFSYYKFAKKQKIDIPVEALDLIADKLLLSLIAKTQKITSSKLDFPEDNFNNTLKSKLQLMDQLNADVNEIRNTGSGKGIVEAYKNLIETYEQVGSSIRDFTPPNKTPEYIQSFKNAMRDVYIPILDNASKLRGEITKVVLDNNILSNSNYNVLFKGTFQNFRYFSERPAVMMDRGGRR